MRARARSFIWPIVWSVTCALLLSGCQINYILQSAVSQADLLMKRVPIEDALKDPALTDEHKRKLQLALDARKFAERELGLKETRNYTSFVQLDRPYVTYVVSAALRSELKPHLWSYPLVGELPYRGYFKEQSAKDEAKGLENEGLDSYVRGVSAYSTLGWFRDPILSSMLAYKDHDLVNTIIHETVHATIYIRSEADFNERLATYIGNKGTEIYYRKKEGENSPTLERIRRENNDDKLFSTFISKETESLKKWYEERLGQPLAEEDRKSRLREVQTRFVSEIQPKLGGTGYRSFEKGEMNNARLLTYQLYFEDLSDFEAMFQKLGGDFNEFLKFCKSLENVEKPHEYLATQAHKPPEQNQ